jgi:hypothetical protein
MILSAAHRKNPILSNTMDITIVDKMVMAAPLTVSAMTPMLESGTMPVRRRMAAPTETGTASFIPLGRHMRKTTVRMNTREAVIVCTSTMLVRLASGLKLKCVRFRSGSRQRNRYLRFYLLSPFHDAQSSPFTRRHWSKEQKERNAGKQYD